MRTAGSQVNYQYVSIELFRVWLLSELIVCVLAVGLAVGLRRRLAPWVTCLLLLGAWIALAPIEVFVQEGRDAILQRVVLPYWGIRPLNDLLLMPFLVLGMAPLVLALTDALEQHPAGKDLG